ncbi:hypothetical protein [Beijerinckia indica]|uniref:hypothetical protein n=1 Tax=Beijerinckia indica TaxID=533 RepID=UPI00030A300F|nr:hypothetical protein [Beijerinckia indica]
MRYPFILDCQAADDLGYVPATTYAETIGAICDWLVNAVGENDWRGIFPLFVNPLNDHFDYAVEDDFCARR